MKKILLASFTFLFFCQDFFGTTPNIANRAHEQLSKEEKKGILIGTNPKRPYDPQSDTVYAQLIPNDEAKKAFFDCINVIKTEEIFKKFPKENEPNEVKGLHLSVNDETIEAYNATVNCKKDHKLGLKLEEGLNLFELVVATINPSIEEIWDAITFLKKILHYHKKINEKKDKELASLKEQFVRLSGLKKEQLNNVRYINLYIENQEKRLKILENLGKRDLRKARQALQRKVYLMAKKYERGIRVVEIEAEGKFNPKHCNIQVVFEKGVVANKYPHIRLAFADTSSEQMRTNAQKKANEIVQKLVTANSKIIPYLKGKPVVFSKMILCVGDLRLLEVPIA